MDEDEKFQAIVNSYNEAFSTPAGQTVLEDLARSCFVYKTTFTPGDPHATAFNEGMRHVVTSIFDMIRRTTTLNQEDNRNGSSDTSRYDTEYSSGPDSSDSDRQHLYFSPRTGNS